MSSCGIIPHGSAAGVESVVEGALCLFAEVKIEILREIPEATKEPRELLAHTHAALVGLFDVIDQVVLGFDAVALFLIPLRNRLGLLRPLLHPPFA